MGSGNVKSQNQAQLSDRPTAADTMPCHACDSQFTIFRRKHECIDCVKMFCSNCINKMKDKKICRICQAVKQNMARPALMQLKIRDLQQYLTVRHVSTESCTEKTDLVDLLIDYLIEKGLIPRPTPVQSSMFSPPVAERVSSSFNRDSRSSSASNPVSQQDALNSNIPEHSRKIGNNVDADVMLERTQQDVSDDDEYLEDTQKGITNSSLPRTTTTAAITTTTTTTEHVPSSTTTEESEEVKKERLERRRQQELRDAEARFNTEGRQLPTEDPRPKKKRASISDLQNVDDINELSVRALKEILVVNFVDYRGCVEKQELVERVKRLYNSKKKQNDALSKEDPSEETDENLCKICMDALIDCVLLECGHMVTCTKCGKVLAECPICRVYITRVVHTFKS